MSNNKNRKKININNDEFIMLPTVDFAFKLLFGDVNHKERLRSLLTSILNMPKEAFVGIELINTELPRIFKEDKMGVLDVRVRLADGKEIDLEIQVIPVSFYARRVLYYLAKIYTMQIHKGDTFDMLKKCISINILDYAFLPVKKMHTKYQLIENETGHKLTDILELHFFELEKLREGINITDKDDPAMDWMKFIGAKTKGEMEMIANKSDLMRDAFEYLQEMSKDKNKRMAYESRQAWIMDQRTREKIAREEGKKGIKEGIKEGEKEGVRKIVIGMIKKGWIDKFILSCVVV